MEVPYRNTKLLIKVIPKDTLLFRIVRSVEDDLRGVSIQDGKRCITPNYNVFFHPNPFVGGISLKGFLQKDQQFIHVYKLKQDIKVLWLLSPSKYSRRTKNEKGTFVKRCSTVKKGCLPRTGHDYDPCLSDTIISKYPDIVGIMAISIGDNKNIKRDLKKTKRIEKYFKFAKDSRGTTGIPELILHPLTKRSSKDLILSDSDMVENNYEHLGKFNIKNYQELEIFMNKHSSYNPDTYFFKYM